MALITTITLTVSAFLLALVTGLFYSYSVSVNPGLAKLSDGEYLKAMQAINRAILNPLFFASFMGSLIMLPVCTWLVGSVAGFDMSFYLLLASSILYAAGVFAVTIFGNVPLNEALDAFNIANATPDELRNKRIEFETPWNRLHFIRTLANMLALLTALTAIVRQAKLSD